MQKLVMGNEAIALGAIRAGVGLVTGYPGTPSTEVLENIAKYNDGSIYVEWSVNEKSALEVAAGASYSGARTLVTMKMVGLNVASDPLMSLEYVGVKGGMVILVADDPGPISSQTEQDTRRFGDFSKVPVFDPSSPEEAYAMMPAAYELSEKYHTPVFMRPTTRICHACASIEISDEREKIVPEGLVKSPELVIFPKLSYGAHKRIFARNEELRTVLSDNEYNKTTLTGGRKGIAAGGVSRAYMKEAMGILGCECPMLEVGIPYPFPEKAALDFLSQMDEVLVYEELDPVIEDELIFITGKYDLKVKIRGKYTADCPCAGENGTEAAVGILSAYLGIGSKNEGASPDAEAPALPVRPPVLCAGCPHRASFYAVKKAMEKIDKKAVFCGDIGCYTLGNAAPLNMTDTCLCMGAGITIAQGIGRIEPETICFSFTGDSTFFHTGIAGIVNAVYNEANMIAVVLDNSTTAMTGQQPNPSTGFNAMGEVAGKISIEKVLESLGCSDVRIVNPYDLEEAMKTVTETVNEKGVRAIVFRAPCIAVSKRKAPMKVDSGKCIGCRKCVKELGCPAIVSDGKKVRIDSGLCTGCGICAKVCPVGAIGE